MERLIFVTGNKHKLRESATILKQELENVELDLPEIQALDVEVVAKQKAIDAYKLLGKPLFVDDAGLEIDSLKGFPGALQTWIAKTIGKEGLLKLVEGKDRSASAVICVAYHDGKEVHTFCEKTHGSISETVRGGEGWDYDFIFVPDGTTQTYSEMGPLEKNKVSHRFKALSKLRNFLSKAA